jgi:hypothetical protein
MKINPKVARFITLAVVMTGFYASKPLWNYVIEQARLNEAIHHDFDKTASLQIYGQIVKEHIVTHDGHGTLTMTYPDGTQEVINCEVTVLNGKVVYHYTGQNGKEWNYTWDPKSNTGFSGGFTTKDKEMFDASGNKIGSLSIPSGPQ